MTNETEGPVACGGDLTIKGSYQVQVIHNSGTFTVGGVKIGLLVNGKVNYTSGNAVQVQSNTYVKIGNSTGSTVWYYDQNNATPPIRVTPTAGGYNGSPRIGASGKFSTAWRRCKQ
ncbi:choice-of-anchor A family protein [Flavobacterium sp. J372]|uniref:choice-of-anchor A family protein n=1 Tax=Flavobacterium sp. J372 TaxID=2898436 RepID=UPI00215176E4|nr:choice-of-anchor A family protein [Flavobacterium sp. J372]